MSDTSTCPSCEIAATEPLTGLFHETCPECQARAIAHGPEYAISQAAGRFLPAYRALLQRIGGADWEALHRRVKAWDQRMRSAR